MIGLASQPRKADLAQFAPEVRHGLDQLLRALDYARDLGSPLWDFAVEIERLLALGMTTSDLRWLVKRGYLRHAREVTVAQDTDRRFDPAEQNLAFPENTCFVLAEAGQALFGRDDSPANQAVMFAQDAADLLPHTVPMGPIGPAAAAPHELSSREPAAQAAALPNWDKDRRTFVIGEYLIKHFRVPSANQEAVLNAFQEEGWPASIDDPLQPIPDMQPKDRLRNTIKSLNLNQATPLIRFRGDGTGQRVLWELRPESASRAESAESRPLPRAA